MILGPEGVGLGSTAATAIDYTQRAAELLAYYGISYTVRNPLEAMALVAVLSNPTLRATAFQIIGMTAKGAVRDSLAAMQIINRNLVAPAAKRATQRLALLSRSPALAGLVFVTGGAALSTYGQQVVNDNAIAINQDLRRGGGQTKETARFDLFRSDLPLIWSPGGGYGSFTVV